MRKVLARIVSPTAALAGWIFLSGMLGAFPIARGDTASWTVYSSDAASVGRQGAAGVFDTRRDQALMLCGYTYVQCSGGLVTYYYPSDGLSHSLQGDVPWAHFSTTGDVPKLQSGAAVYDSLLDAVWWFGGSVHVTSPPAYPVPRSPRNTVYRLTPDTGVWQAFPASGETPPRIELPVMVFEDPGRRLLLLGGRDSSGNAVGGVFATALDAPGVWDGLTPAGGPPPDRWGACAAFDRDSNRVLLVGGLAAGGPVPTDLWALDLSGSGAWQMIPTSGPPPSGRCWGALDRTSGRLIVLSGSPVTVRTLDLTTRQWSLLSSDGTVPTVPNGRYDAAAIHDPLTRRLVFAWPHTVSLWCSGMNYADTYVLSIVDPSVSVPIGSRAGGWSIGPAFPNPAHGRLSFTVQFPDDRPATLELFDVHGRRLWFSGVRGQGEQRVDVDVSPFAAGVVFLKVTRDGDSRIVRAAVVR